MDTKGYTNIYDYIFNTDRNLDKLFEEKVKPLKKEAVKKLLDFIHITVEENFPKVKIDTKDDRAEEKYEMSYNQFSRFRLVTLLLTIVSIQGKYNNNMFNNASKFCKALNGDEKKSYEVNFS